MHFSKPAKTWKEQVELLRSRGLTIDDDERALHYLSHINYYRLAAYCRFFESSHAPHRFRHGTHFDDILNAYLFDRELRLLLLDAIERIEVSVRAQWAYFMAHTYGPHGFLESTWVVDSKKHHKDVRKLEKSVKKAKDTFVLHYRDTYESPDLPPVWMVSELLTFGSLSRWIGNMKVSDLKTMARPYGFPADVFRSALTHLSYVRNLCAHHSRVWNRQFTIRMQLPKTHPRTLIENFHPEAHARVYNTLVLLAWLMDQISEGHKWKERLHDLLRKYQLPLNEMGFPDGWTKRPLWTFPSFSHKIE